MKLAVGWGTMADGAGGTGIEHGILFQAPRGHAARGRCVCQGSAESAVREISGSEIGEMLNLVMLVHLSTSGA